MILSELHRNLQRLQIPNPATCRWDNDLHHHLRLPYRVLLPTCGLPMSWRLQPGSSGLFLCLFWRVGHVGHVGRVGQQFLANLREVSFRASAWASRVECCREGRCVA